MYRDSIYEKKYKSSEVTQSTGYDYHKEGLVKRFFAKRMFMNPFIESYIYKLEPMLKLVLDSMKKIQFYHNFAIDKNDRSLNL